MPTYALLAFSLTVGGTAAGADRPGPELTPIDPDRCGPLALRVCAARLGTPADDAAVSAWIDHPRVRTNLAELRDAATGLGFATAAVRWEAGREPGESSVPAILPVLSRRGEPHFVAIAGAAGGRMLVVDVPHPAVWITAEQLRGTRGWDGTALYVAAYDDDLAPIRAATVGPVGPFLPLGAAFAAAVAVLLVPRGRLRPRRGRAALLGLTLLPTLVGCGEDGAVATRSAARPVAPPDAAGLGFPVATADRGEFSAPGSATVTVRNDGRGPLRITGVDTSCGCTTVRGVSRPLLAAGESTKFEVSLSPPARGKKQTRVTVSTDSRLEPKASVPFLLRGALPPTPSVVECPKRLTVEFVAVEPATTELVVRTAETPGTPPWLAELRDAFGRSLSAVSAREEIESDDVEGVVRVYRLALTVPAPAPDTPDDVLDARLVTVGGDEVGPVVRIARRSRPALEPQPSRVFVNLSRMSDGPVVRDVVLRRTAAEGGLTVDANLPPWLTVETIPATADRPAKLRLRVDTEAVPPGESATTITVRAGADRTEVPVVVLGGAAA